MILEGYVDAQNNNICPLASQKVSNSFYPINYIKRMMSPNIFPVHWKSFPMVFKYLKFELEGLWLEWWE